jgi:hypothetical protein
MSVRLNDGTNFGETFFSFSYCPSRLRGWMKPSLKKPGDFTMAKGHGHPLVIIILQPCALNGEFQHLILRFNKNFLTLQIPLKEGGGNRR